MSVTASAGPILSESTVTINLVPKSGPSGPFFLFKRLTNRVNGVYLGHLGVLLLLPLAQQTMQRLTRELLHKETYNGTQYI